jgi:imidazolonepropionase-like amidohydrolase
MGYKAVEKANKPGVRLVVGDDFGTSWMPQGTYALELDFCAKYGAIAPLDVIRWATRNGAGLLGMSDEIGTIEAGKNRRLAGGQRRFRYATSACSVIAPSWMW